MRSTFFSLLAFALMVVGGCGEETKKLGATNANATAQASPASAIDAEKLYNRYCFSCHAAGIANAPRFGDSEAWSPRLAKGRDLLLASVKNGIAPGMPAKGLCIACSDAELAAVTDYMLEAAAP